MREDRFFEPHKKYYWELESFGCVEGKEVHSFKIIHICSFKVCKKGYFSQNLREITTTSDQRA
jgi:hypothetical protein